MAKNLQNDPKTLVFARKQNSGPSLKRAQDFPPEQKSRFWDYYGDILPCFTDFLNAVNSQLVDGFFCSTPEMKARDAYVPFLLFKPLNKIVNSELFCDKKY